jgi:hypothetical protein
MIVSRERAHRTQKPFFPCGGNGRNHFVEMHEMISNAWKLFFQPLENVDATSSSRFLGWVERGGDTASTLEFERTET